MLAPVSKPLPEELLIVHAGSRTPPFVIPGRCFRQSRKRRMRVWDISKIRLRFFGGGAFGESTDVKRAVVATGLSERVEFQPRVAYGQILEELLKADLLVLLQNSPDTQELVPAKLFEYLARSPRTGGCRPGCHRGGPSRCRRRLGRGPVCPDRTSRRAHSRLPGRGERHPRRDDRQSDGTPAVQPNRARRTAGGQLDSLVSRSRS